jgi:3-phosphoshikimate 1-carboxyvinyltransferase
LKPASSLPQDAAFASYKDHRMAMAFAPLSTLMNVDVERPEVVRKSYPNFWNDIRNVGFTVHTNASVLK